MGKRNNENLPTSITEEKQVQLHNSGGLKVGGIIDQSLSLLTPEQQQNLAGKAAEAALALEIKAREHNIDYYNGRKAAEDHTETFAMLDKQGKLTSQKIVSDIKTGAGQMRIESKSGTTCFVATAAYGNPDHADVVFLRNFRDGLLVNYEAGRAFISWYWKAGPKLAGIVKKSSTLQVFSKWCLSCLVSLLRLTWRQ